MAEKTGDIPQDLHYTTEHEWLRLQDGNARVGLTDYAQEQLGDVVYVDLPKVGDQVTFMQKMAEVESVKVVSEIFSPASGEIIEVNEALRETPELVNREPYGQGWLVVIRPGDQAEVDRLLSPAAYLQLVRSEIEGHEA